MPNKLTKTERERMMRVLDMMRRPVDPKREAPTLWACNGPSGGYAVYRDGTVIGSRGRGRITDTGIRWEEDDLGLGLPKPRTSIYTLLNKRRTEQKKESTSK